jgi:hypothetical protein
LPADAVVVNVGGNDWFSTHFHEGEGNGRAKREVRPLQWTADGWPATD